MASQKRDEASDSLHSASIAEADRLENSGLANSFGIQIIEMESPRQSRFSRDQPLRSTGVSAIQGMVSWALVFVLFSFFAVERCVRNLSDTGSSPMRISNLASSARSLAEGSDWEGGDLSLQYSRLLCIFGDAMLPFLEPGASLHWEPPTTPQELQPLAVPSVLTPTSLSRPTVSPSELLPQWSLNTELPDLGPDVSRFWEEPVTRSSESFSQPTSFVLSRVWPSPPQTLSSSEPLTGSAGGLAFPFPTSSAWNPFAGEAGLLGLGSEYRGEVAKSSAVGEAEDCVDPYEGHSPVFQVSTDSGSDSELTWAKPGPSASKIAPTESMHRERPSAPPQRKAGSLSRRSRRRTEKRKDESVLLSGGLAPRELETWKRFRAARLRKYMLQHPKHCFYYPGDPDRPNKMLSAVEQRAMDLFQDSASRSSPEAAFDKTAALLIVLRTRGADEARLAASKAEEARIAWLAAASQDPLFRPPIFPPASLIASLSLSPSDLFSKPNAPEASKLCRLLQRKLAVQVLDATDMEAVRNTLERLLIRIPPRSASGVFSRLEGAGRALARWVMVCDFVFVLNRHVPDFIAQSVVDRIMREAQQSVGSWNVNTLMYGTVDALALFSLTLRSFASGERPNPVLLVHAKRLISRRKYNSAFNWRKAKAFLTEDDINLLRRMNMHSHVFFPTP